jgi:hypothetical protein
VGVDAVVQTQPVNQPVGGCEIDPGLKSLVNRRRPCLGGVVSCAGHFRLHPFSDFFSLRAAQHLDKIKVSTIDDQKMITR